VLVLDQRHKVLVVIPLDDEDAPAGVAFGVRMFENVEQVAAFDVEDDVLEPNAALRPETRVVRVGPVEVLHRNSGYNDVCLVGTHWHRSSVPAGVPKLGPRTINRHPTPTNEPTKNG
jgi:hypothetical protein